MRGVLAIFDDLEGGISRLRFRPLTISGRSENRLEKAPSRYGSALWFFPKLHRWAFKIRERLSDIHAA